MPSKELDETMSLFDSTVAVMFIIIMVIVAAVTGTASQATNKIITNTLNPVLTGQGLANYNYVNKMIPQMDWIFMFLFIGINIAILIKSAFLDTTLLDFAVAWFTSVIIIFFSMLFSNIFVNVLQTSALATGVALFPNGAYIVRWFPLFNAIFLGLYSVVMLTRIRNGDVDTNIFSGVSR